MKYNIFSTIATVCAAGLMLSACMPEDYELGSKVLNADDLTEGVAYTVEVDQTTNTVTMKSLLTPSYTVLWEYDGGRSQKAEVTVQYPFAGDKYAVFGVETRGGVVYGDTCWFHINSLKTDLLEDELWSIISGGIGESKTWVLDLDANGTSQRFGGPVWFWTYGYSWDALHASNGDNFLDASPWDPTSAIAPFLDDSGAAQWYWAADWAGNSWIGDAADYGEMTFDLKEGANVTTDMSGTGLGSFKGSWMLDVAAHTITFTDAWPLVTPNYWNQVTTEVPSRTFEILYLNEDNMILLANTGTNTPISLNYIRKGWEPEEEIVEGDVVQPDYGGDPNTDLTTTVTTTKQWMLVADAPYDWYFWNSVESKWESNGFNKPADYGTWAPVADSKKVANFILTMTTAGENGGQYTFNDMEGNTIEGKYTTNGVDIDFGQEITWFTASAEGEHPWSVEIKAQSLRLLQNSGSKSSPVYWLGTPTKWNAKGDVTEYLAFKIEELSGSKPAIPARNVDVNNDNLHWGDIEGKGNLRIEICNKYGSGTWDNPVVNYQDIDYDEKMVINFTVSGFGTCDPIQGFIMHSANMDITPQYGAEEGKNTFDFTGDGTYDVTIFGSAAVDENLVLNIDINGAQDYLSVDLTNIVDNKVPGTDVHINSIKIDGSEGSEGEGGGTTPVVNPGLKIDVNNDLIKVGDLEGNGRIRFEIYNIYGSGTADNPPLVVDDLDGWTECKVSFSLEGLDAAGVTGSFEAAPYYADESWAYQISMPTVAVTGDGTYTIDMVSNDAVPKPIVFVIDINDLGAALGENIDGVVGKITELRVWK